MSGRNLWADLRFRVMVVLEDPALWRWVEHTLPHDTNNTAMRTLLGVTRDGDTSRAGTRLRADVERLARARARHKPRERRRVPVTRSVREAHLELGVL